MHKRYIGKHAIFVQHYFVKTIDILIRKVYNNYTVKNGENNMDIVKVSWSGGKDSTCSALHHIDRGDHTKLVTYIPMFTDEIPLLLRVHYEFIMNTKKRFEEKVESLGYESRIIDQGGDI